MYSLPCWRVESLVKGDYSHIQMKSILDDVVSSLQAVVLLCMLYFQKEFEVRNYRNYLFAKADYLGKSIGIEGSIQLNVASTLSQQCTFLQEEVDCLSERRVAPFFVSHI